jgi:prevent-host-death family protein
MIGIASSSYGVPVLYHAGAHPACHTITNDYSDYNDYSIMRHSMPADTWTVAEAKAKFSTVIARARAGEPQAVTKNGRLAVVIVAAEEWEQKTKRVGNLAEFFAASPLRGSGIRVKRKRDRPRKAEL